MLCLRIAWDLLPLIGFPFAVAALVISAKVFASGRKNNLECGQALPDLGTLCAALWEFLLWGACLDRDSLVHALDPDSSNN